MSELDKLGYDLSKHIPDMERGFDIVTNYGPLHIDAEDAAPIVEAVKKMLEKKLVWEMRTDGGVE